MTANTCFSFGEQNIFLAMRAKPGVWTRKAVGFKGVLIVYEAYLPQMLEQGFGGGMAFLLLTAQAFLGRRLASYAVPPRF